MQFWRIKHVFSPFREFFRYSKTMSEFQGCPITLQRILRLEGDDEQHRVLIQSDRELLMSILDGKPMQKNVSLIFHAVLPPAEILKRWSVSRHLFTQFRGFYPSDSVENSIRNDSSTKPRSLFEVRYDTRCRGTIFSQNFPAQFTTYVLSS